MPAMMTAPSRVTVISAWFNRMEGLEESVRSVLAQDGVDFDYVIVDDCSTDGTGARLEALAREDPRLVILRNDINIGLTRSLRRAVAAARGEYVAVHGAGDISLPGRLAAQVAFLDDNTDHVVVGTGVVNHNLVTGRRETARFAPMESGNTPYTHGEVMYRKAAYEAVEGYRDLFRYSQDNDLWRRLGEIGRLGRVEALLYERRIFSDGVGGSPGKMVLQAVFSNLGVFAAQERAAGRRDPVAKDGAAALLTQKITPRAISRISLAVKGLLRERRFAEAVAALETVPLGLLSGKLLLVYLVLRPFHRRPRMSPVPPVERLRPEPPAPFDAAAHIPTRSRG